jgi:hypothetical protein
MSTVANTDRENPPTTVRTRIQEVRTRLGEDLRRNDDEESQCPYNGYDDADEEVYRNAPFPSQSKLEESIDVISEQLRLMNQR